MKQTDYPLAEMEQRMNEQGVLTLGNALTQMSSRLKNSDTADLDAQGLLAHVLKRSRAWILGHTDEKLSTTSSAELETLVLQLEKGTPLPYIVGHWEFYKLDFEVTPDVLIPRPETELLVERSITWLKHNPNRRNAADVGTGSGCIGIALASNVSDLRVLASDNSSSALEIARRNAIRNGVSERITFECCDLLPENREFDLIVANLPYIPTTTLLQLPVFKHEPASALDGGEDGLRLIGNLLTIAPERLVPGGLLVMEIEASQGPAALSLAYDAFSEAEIHLYRDLAGHDRILEVQR
jgi:release factor glutamine methyltransferase